jgi:hypothetical protein
MRGLLGLLIHQSFVTANHGDVRERQTALQASGGKPNVLADCLGQMCFIQDPEQGI